jgi:biopolymer transport protein TolR
MAGGLMGGGSRNGRGGRYRTMAEINVTPLVDVMLVLLIVFMVTAPLLTSGVNVDLPKTSTPQLNTDAKPISVSITADGKLHVQDDDVELGDLVAKLQAISENDTTRRILLRIDKTVSYGQMAPVMAAMVQGGFTKVSLRTEQAQQ